jgi:hypothetical protein
VNNSDETKPQVINPLLYRKVVIVLVRAAIGGQKYRKKSVFKGFYVVQTPF